MIKNVVVRKHSMTGKYYASCGSTGPAGQCTQWGQTKSEALDNLKKYLVDVMGEVWDENNRDINLMNEKERKTWENLNV